MRLQLQYAPTYAPHTVYLVDLKGRIRDKIALTPGATEKEWDVSRYPRGTYFLYALGDQGYTNACKIVLQ